MRTFAVGNHILVEQLNAEIATKSQLALPDDAKDSMKIAKGTVIDTGVLMLVAPGQVVYFNKFSGDRIQTPDGKEFLVLQEKDILARDEGTETPKSVTNTSGI